MSHNIICPACARPGLVNGKCLLCQFDTSTDYTEYLLLSDPIENVVPPSHLRLEHEKEEQLLRERIAQIDPLAKRVTEMESQLLELVPAMNRVSQLEKRILALEALPSPNRISQLEERILALEALPSPNRISQLEERILALETLPSPNRISQPEERILAPELSDAAESSPPSNSSETSEPLTPAMDLPLIPMRQFDVSDDHVWEQTDYYREEIISIRFLTTMPDLFFDSDSWDLSEAGDGSIMAWVENETNLIVAANGIISLPPDCDFMFAYFNNLESIYLEAVDTSRVTNMTSMFLDCNRLSSLQLGQRTWDTSHVTSFRNMFRNCYSLSELQISSWDTSRVTDMSFMFRGCEKLESLDLHTWNTAALKKAHGMFQNCNSLKTQNLHQFGIN